MSDKIDFRRMVMVDMYMDFGCSEDVAELLFDSIDPVATTYELIAQGRISENVYRNLVPILFGDQP